MDTSIVGANSAEYNNSFDNYYEMIKFFSDNGFTHYPYKPFNKPGTEPYYFQRKYTDDAGTKYFVTAYIVVMPFGKYEYRVQFETQLYQKHTHDAVNQIFIDWKLSQIEAWVDSLFAAGLIEHYELGK